MSRRTSAALPVGGDAALGMSRRQETANGISQPSKIDSPSIGWLRPGHHFIWQLGTVFRPGNTVSAR